MSLLNITEPATKRARQSETESDIDSEGNEDRFSDLPDCLLLHILSLVKCKDAVRTCVLSKRWKHLWKRLPTLILHSRDFGTLVIFTKFVSRLLSLRDSSVALLTFDFNRGGIVESHIFKKVLNYAISHNVHQLRLEVEASVDQLLPSISCVFSCQTLTSLRLFVNSKNRSGVRIVFPQSLYLPALTSLEISNIAFCASGIDQAEPFSTLNRLNNLVLENCALKDAQILCICSTTLSNLTLRPKHQFSYKIVFSTPNLSSFAFYGIPCHDLSGLSSVEQVHIDASTWEGSPKAPSVLLNWLKALADVQSLTLAINTFQVLFRIHDLSNIKLPSLGNLKSLKVKMLHHPAYPIKSLDTIPHGILDFLHQNSLTAEVTII